MKPVNPNPSPLVALILMTIKHSASPDDYGALVLIARMMALALSSPADAARVLNEVADNLR